MVEVDGTETTPARRPHHVLRHPEGHAEPACGSSPRTAGTARPSAGAEGQARQVARHPGRAGHTSGSSRCTPTRAQWQEVLVRLSAAQLLDLVEPADEPARGPVDGVGGALSTAPTAAVAAACPSTFLADRAAEVPVPVFLQRSPHFRPPEDADTPMIMVGPGTGHRTVPRLPAGTARASAPTGRNWLFFGDQHRRDRISTTETTSSTWSATASLGEMDLAFSRDQKDRVYVQHRMLERGAEVWRRLPGRRALLRVRRRQPDGPATSTTP